MNALRKINERVAAWAGDWAASWYWRSWYMSEERDESIMRVLVAMSGKVAA